MVTVAGPLPAGRGGGGASAAPRVPRRLPLAFKPPRAAARGRGRGGPPPPAPRICQAPRGLVPQCLPATRERFFHSVTFPRRSPSLRREASVPSRGRAEPAGPSPASLRARWKRRGRQRLPQLCDTRKKLYGKASDFSSPMGRASQRGFLPTGPRDAATGADPTAYRNPSSLVFSPAFPPVRLFAFPQPA